MQGFLALGPPYCGVWLEAKRVLRINGGITENPVVEMAWHIR